MARHDRYKHRQPRMVRFKDNNTSLDRSWTGNSPIASLYLAFDLYDYYLVSLVASSSFSLGVDEAFCVRLKKITLFGHRPHSLIKVYSYRSISCRSNLAHDDLAVTLKTQSYWDESRSSRSVWCDSGPKQLLSGMLWELRSVSSSIPSFDLG